MTGRKKFPVLRGECEHLIRPCEWSNCKYALPLGECTLDHAAKGGMTLAEVGDVLNLSRERVRQIEENAVKKVTAEFKKLGIEPSFFDPGSNWEEAGDDGDA